MITSGYLHCSCKQVTGTPDHITVSVLSVGQNEGFGTVHCVCYTYGFLVQLCQYVYPSDHQLKWHNQHSPISSKPEPNTLYITSYTTSNQCHSARHMAILNNCTFSSVHSKEGVDIQCTPHIVQNFSELVPKTFGRENFDKLMALHM